MQYDRHKLYQPTSQQVQAGEPVYNAASSADDNYVQQYAYQPNQYSAGPAYNGAPYGAPLQQQQAIIPVVGPQEKGGFTCRKVTVLALCAVCAALLLFSLSLTWAELEWKTPTGSVKLMFQLNKYSGDNFQRSVPQKYFPTATASCMNQAYSYSTRPCQIEKQTFDTCYKNCADLIDMNGKAGESAIALVVITVVELLLCAVVFIMWGKQENSVWNTFALIFTVLLIFLCLLPSVVYFGTTPWNTFAKCSEDFVGLTKGFNPATCVVLIDSGTSNTGNAGPGSSGGAGFVCAVLMMIASCLTCCERSRVRQRHQAALKVGNDTSADAAAASTYVAQSLPYTYAYGPPQVVYSQQQYYDTNSPYVAPAVGQPQDPDAHRP
jgi:hypothetical protein